MCVKYDKTLFVRKTCGQREWRQNFNDFGKIGEALQSDYVTTWQGSLASGEGSVQLTSEY